MIRRLSNWEYWLDWILMIAAVAFLAAYAIPIVWPNIDRSYHWMCEISMWIIWVLFALDYLVRLYLSPNRREFISSHLLDLAIIVLPLLRPLRLLRLVTMLRFLDRRFVIRMRGRIVSYVVGGTALLTLVAALSVLDAERANSEANIKSFGDALWWSITTMSTVGYGDLYPTTTMGRITAVGLMIGGVTILGTVTGTMSSWIVDRVKEDERAEIITKRSCGD